jgi:hypothetical protein
MLLAVKRFASIPTKSIKFDAPTKSTNNETPYQKRMRYGGFPHDAFYRVNKFGVHWMKYDYKCIESCSHKHFLTVAEQNSELRSTILNELVNHINFYEKIDADENVSDATLKITIHNHAYPLFHLNQFSNIVINGDTQWLVDDKLRMQYCGFSDEDYLKKEFFSNYHVANAREKCKKYFPDYKLTTTKYTFSGIQLPGNEFNFIFYKDFLDKIKGIKVDYDFDKVGKVHYHHERKIRVQRASEINWHFMKSCPENILNDCEYSSTNISKKNNADDQMYRLWHHSGKNNEIFCHSGSIIELNLHIIPNIWTHKTPFGSYMDLRYDIEEINV